MVLPLRKDTDGKDIDGKFNPPKENLGGSLTDMGAIPNCGDSLEDISLAVAKFFNNDS